tara:strand:+ start:750 stop:1361 length:612 start_codon:yes stop_codon:yes gene_type:complete
MIRILPFRQYDENDVINLFALEDASVNENVTGSDYGDAGVFVTVSEGNLDLDPVSYADNAYLGKTNYPHVGANQYPSVNLKVKPAIAGDSLLGLTLRQTAKYDENGEKLLYNRQKAEELQCMLPGQAVPVLSKGVIEIAATAYDGDLTVGGGLKLSAGVSGTVTGCSVTDSARIGMVLGTGSRTSGNTADQFAGTTALIALGL